MRLTLAILSVAAFASPGLSMPQSFKVKTVVVARDGQWHADRYGHQTRGQCARFRVSRTAALRWFTRAKEVTQRDWQEDLDWTQCSATGTLRTDGGHIYHWELDQSGRGRVILSPTVSVYLAGRELPFSPR